MTDHAPRPARSPLLRLLGSAVDLSDESGATVSGVVDAVTGGDAPQLLVNGQYYDYGKVLSVKRNVKE